MWEESLEAAARRKVVWLVGAVVVVAYRGRGLVLVPLAPGGTGRAGAGSGARAPAH